MGIQDDIFDIRADLEDAGNTGSVSKFDRLVEIWGKDEAELELLRSERTKIDQAFRLIRALFETKE